MDKEKTLNKITVLEREIRRWKDKSETDPDRQSAAAARLDLRRVERKYKDLLLELSDRDCDDIRKLAADKGIGLDFFDELNCSETEKQQIREQNDKADKELEELYKAHPEFLRALREGIAEDLKTLNEKIGPDRL